MLLVASTEGVGLITSIATVVAAAIVASVAAVTTNKRLTKQITAQREKQERDLMAAGERQELALAHARELSDIADLRALLDEAAVALDEARQPFNQAEAIVASRIVPYSVGDASELVDALVGDIETHVLLQTLAVRLAVRLGSDHPITAEFRRAGEAIHQLWLTFAREYDPAAPLSAKRGDTATALATFLDAGGAFLEAAVERAGTVPAKGGTSGA
ncbi:MAG TPA: hypothetical protein VK790_05345 [Solirubrobacteraceae bacterium]|jgi:hypothetical protein|nr:hypothetical protein [Solirubrobacteraceae bacterium]